MFGKKKILNLKSSYLRYFKGKMMIKSILIHEYQHGSTRINTNQHKSTRINTSPTRINTSQHESDTNQHESTRVQHESTRVNTSPKQVTTFQKQPPEVFFVKRCSEKFHKIHRKTPVPEPLF